MKRGKKYIEAAKLVDRTQLYEVADGVALVKKTAGAKFDETVEVHIRTGCDGRHADQQIRGAVVLPHGTGKTVRVLVFAKGAKLDEALAETPRVRADLGYPPLVTPTSQMVGVQAVTNVLVGERYKKVSKEVKAYCRGEYGTTPAPIDPAVQKLILGDEKPLSGRFADTLEPIVDKTRKELEGVARCDEDVLSYIAFPNLAEKFFEERKEKEENEVTYTIVEA